MPRILDIGAFNAVREAGLAKLVPPVPRIAVGMGTCGRGNGAEGLYHAFAAGDREQRRQPRAGARRLFWRLLSGAAGQRSSSRDSRWSCLRRVQANDAARILHDIATAISART